MLTYRDCQDLLRKARHGRRKLANNTYLADGNGPGEFALYLHGNPILTFSPDGLVRVDDCRWRTATTKARLNEYGPVGIYQRRGDWLTEPDGKRLEPGTRYPVTSNDHERPLVLAIAARPSDPLPKLIFADWLDENGETDRAAAIRAQVATDVQESRPVAREVRESGAVVLAL